MNLGTKRMHFITLEDYNNELLTISIKLVVFYFAKSAKRIFNVLKYIEKIVLLVGII